MPELTLRFFDVGPGPLRTERLTVEDNEAAIALARMRLRDSRFKTATVYVGETFVVRIGPDGLPRRSAERLVSAALIDSLAAELIGSGLVRSGRLADRIEAAAEQHAPAGQSVLRAFARGLRERRPPDLTLVQGGLAQTGDLGSDEAT